MIVSRQYAMAQLGARKRTNSTSQSVGDFGFLPLLIPVIGSIIGSIGSSAIGASSAEAQAQQARDIALQQSATAAQLAKMGAENQAISDAEKTRRYTTIAVIAGGALVTLLVVGSLVKRRAP